MTNVINLDAIIIPTQLVYAQPHQKQMMNSEN